uniref:Predicted protein n=1 Tax=Physcomitrium patens TaxID=3218 RepID=A9U1U3_PHYPA
MKRLWHNGLTFKKTSESEIYCSRNETLHARKYHLVFTSGSPVNYIVQTWSKDDSVRFEKSKHHIHSPANGDPIDCPSGTVESSQGSKRCLCRQRAVRILLTSTFPILPITVRYIQTKAPPTIESQLASPAHLDKDSTTKTRSNALRTDIQYECATRSITELCRKKTLVKT